MITFPNQSTAYTTIFIICVSHVHGDKAEKALLKTLTTLVAIF